MMTIIKVIKLKRLLIMLPFFIILIAFLGIFIFKSTNNFNAINAFSYEDSKNALDLENENTKLKDILKSILPMEQKVYNEDTFFRYKYFSSYPPQPPSYQIHTLSDILKKGKDLNFNIVFNDPEYLRPIYDSSWRDTYYRSWLYLPYKNIEARHRLFVYYGGASNIYDFEGSLGFSGNAPVDYHRNINYLVYKFNVKSVKIFEHQIVLTGEPTRCGVQIVAVKVNDILPKDIDSKDFLFQLSTPGGYEIDYEYGSYARSEYLKKLMEEEKNDAKTFSSSSSAITPEKLKKENELLKKELSYFIPLTDGLITEKDCNYSSLGELGPVSSLKIASDNGKSIAFKANYENKNYSRPLYHPAWKKNYQKYWAYIPQQICTGMHKLFYLPENQIEREKLLGTLAFFEDFEKINRNESGFLVYTSSISKVILYNNQVILYGKPSRNSVQVISFDKSNLMKNKNYLIRLATSDNCETDYDILTGK